MRREEIVDDVYGFEDEVLGLKLFRPIRKAWRKFVAFCQPAMDFHDKYIIYILNAVLVIGVALVIGYLYLRR